MTPLLRILLGSAEPGLAPCQMLTPSHRQLAGDFARQTVRIGSGRATTKAEMLAAFARDLELPDWFGHNLDAAHEALYDYMDHRPDVVVIVESPPISGDDVGDALAFTDLIHSVHIERQAAGLLVGVAAPRLLDLLTD